MDGSPVGIPTSFLQPMDPPHCSSEPQDLSGKGVFSSAKAPATFAKDVDSPAFFPGLESGKEINFSLFGLGALCKGVSMSKKRKKINKDELSEDYCFVCKDGGEIRVCDFKFCLKSYHPQCVEKDNSFLESGGRWTCDWHSCYNCRKISTFKCFCCPYSSCRACIGGSELVKVKGTKGFCNNCLGLVKLIEENADVNSDGEVVDFNATDTYEFLFKEYWEIVKEKEGLTLSNLQAAEEFLKMGEKLKKWSDSDENFEDQIEGSDGCGDECFPSKNFWAKQRRMKMVNEKYKSKKMTYVGWASKELIDFLLSIGKDTQQPLSQHDVWEIVKEYIQSNNLLRNHKKKKQHVFCDARLLSLFRRKKVSFFKIYSLLEKHLAENNDSDDESFSLEEDDYASLVKKQRMDKSFSKLKNESQYFRKQALEHNKKSFAALTEANINLVYLKRSLIVELMKDPQTFESKVVGCFVRRECDPKDSYQKVSFGYRPRKIYQLNQITGVKKVSEEYKLGDISTDIVFSVSNYWKAVQISMLSDDNFEEEECEDLRQLVKKGLLKKPEIEELKKKIKIIHEDVVKHSIKRELSKLDKQIVRANEKGWRKELYDCIERKKLLNKPEEIMRLIKELPNVAADIEVEPTEDGNQVVKTKNLKIPNKADFQGSTQGAIPSNITTTNKMIYEEKNGAMRISHGNAANPDTIIAKETHEDVRSSSTLMVAANAKNIIAEEKIEGSTQGAIPRNITTTNKMIYEEKNGAIRISYGNAANPDTIIAKETHEDVRPNSTLMVAANTNKIIAEEKTEEHGNSISTTKMEKLVIEIDDEEEVIDHKGPANYVNTSQEEIWKYKDPSGNVQGPFCLAMLRYWKEQGFFDDDFVIWRASQSQEDAILLTHALRSTYFVS